MVISPTFTATYSVDSSCVTTGTIDAFLDGQLLARFNGVGVVAEGGREIELETLDPGIYDLRRAKRQE